MKTYADTEQGALEFIANETCLKCTSNSKCIPDTAIKGVWKVTDLKVGKRVHIDAIIYMSGYPDPFGGIRDTNDFENSEGERVK